MNQQTNAEATKGYLGSRAEYYGAGEQETVGKWGGEAADRLGLSGLVLQQQFARLCDNLHPFTGEQLTARMRADRRVGYDFNFHASKSVSLVYGLTGDEAILNAFLESLRIVMAEIEQNVRVRVRKRGQMTERLSGNFAYAEHLHFTARPVGGVIDPHLHAHLFVPNVSFDPVEKIWKAIDVASVQENAPHWQARVHRLFGQRLSQLGYLIVWHGTGFEIAGIDRAMIERFSGRTGLINRRAEEQGITDAKTKDRLGAKTRERKRKDLTMPQLREQWRQRLTEHDKAALAVATARRRFSATPPVRHPLPSGNAQLGRRPRPLSQRQRLADDQAHYHQMTPLHAAAASPSPRPGHGR